MLAAAAAAAAKLFPLEAEEAAAAECGWGGGTLIRWEAGCAAAAAAATEAAAAAAAAPGGANWCCGGGWDCCCASPTGGKARGTWKDKKQHYSGDNLGQKTNNSLCKSMAREGQKKSVSQKTSTYSRYWNVDAEQHCNSSGVSKCDSRSRIRSKCRPPPILRRQCPRAARNLSFAPPRTR